MPKALLAEDDVVVCEEVEPLLRAQGLLVDTVIDGDDALVYLKSFAYDLLILAFNLQGVPALEICKRFRSSGGTTPILILMPTNATENRATALDAGADEYLDKPFTSKQLVSRIRALLHRPKIIIGERISAHGLIIDETDRTVTKEGRAIDLQPLEFALLLFFMKNRGKVFSIDELSIGAWDSDSDVSPQALSLSVQRLCKKIDTEGNPSLIVNVAASSYRFKDA